MIKTAHFILYLKSSALRCGWSFIIEPKEKVIDWDDAILNILRSEQEFFTSAEVLKRLKINMAHWLQ